MIVSHHTYERGTEHLVARVLSNELRCDWCGKRTEHILQALEPGSPSSKGWLELREWNRITNDYRRDLCSTFCLVLYVVNKMPAPPGRWRSLWRRLPKIQLMRVRADVDSS